MKKIIAISNHSNPYSLSVTILDMLYVVSRLKIFESMGTEIGDRIKCMLNPNLGSQDGINNGRLVSLIVASGLEATLSQEQFKKVVDGIFLALFVLAVCSGALDIAFPILATGVFSKVMESETVQKMESSMLSDATKKGLEVLAPHIKEVKRYLKSLEGLMLLCFLFEKFYDQY